VASILKSTRARLLVEYSQFALFDHFGTARLTDLGPSTGSDWVGRAGTGGVIFHASDRSLEALVELELWSAAPDIGAETVSERPHFEGVFTSDSGRVMLASLTGSPSDVTVELQGPGTYRVHAVRLGEKYDPEEGQVESWHLRVWSEPS